MLGLAPTCEAWFCTVMWWLLGFAEFMQDTSPWSWIVLYLVFAVCVGKSLKRRFR